MKPRMESERVAKAERRPATEYEQTQTIDTFKGEKQVTVTVHQNNDDPRVP